jgi:hypothetical protein
VHSRSYATVVSARDQVPKVTVSSPSCLNSRQFLLFGPGKLYLFHVLGKYIDGSRRSNCWTDNLFFGRPMKGGRLEIRHALMTNEHRSSSNEGRGICCTW